MRHLAQSEIINIFLVNSPTVPLSIRCLALPKRTRWTAAISVDLSRQLLCHRVRTQCDSSKVYLAINRERKRHADLLGILACRNTRESTRASCTGAASVTVGQVRGEWPESGDSGESGRTRYTTAISSPSLPSQFVANTAGIVRD